MSEEADDRKLTLGQLFQEVPELKDALEDIRRMSHGEAAALDRLLGYRVKQIVCPGCGRVIDARHPERAGR